MSKIMKYKEVQDRNLPCGDCLARFNIQKSLVTAAMVKILHQTAKELEEHYKCYWLAPFALQFKEHYQYQSNVMIILADKIMQKIRATENTKELDTWENIMHVVRWAKDHLLIHDLHGPGWNIPEKRLDQVRGIGGRTLWRCEAILTEVKSLLTPPQDYVIWNAPDITIGVLEICIEHFDTMHEKSISA